MQTGTFGVQNGLIKYYSHTDIYEQMFVILSPTQHSSANQIFNAKVSLKFRYFGQTCLYQNTLNKNGQLKYFLVVYFLETPC